MKELLKKYEEKQPEIVFNWKDSETEAEGWTVINSLRGGAAGGGAAAVITSTVCGRGFFSSAVALTMKFKTIGAPQKCVTL